MGHTSGRGLWNARPPVNIKGIKKKGGAPLEWHNPLPPRVKEPQTTGGHKSKMQPLLGLMIMRKHNQTINNQCAVGHSVKGGIAMEVLCGVVIAQNFCHVKNGAALADPPHHTLLRSLKHIICDPFEDRQMVELVGVVLVVDAASMVAVDGAAGPSILGPAHNGRVLIENGCLL